MTAKQLEAWASFGSTWDRFKSAWLARGFRWPPMGSPDDDDTSQRGLLWQIVDAWPTVSAQWVAGAPGKTTREVIDHVIERYHEKRGDVDDIDPDWEATKAAERQGAGRAMTKVTKGLIARSLLEQEPDFGAEPVAAGPVETTS